VKDFPDMNTSKSRSSLMRTVAGLAVGSAALLTCLSSSDARPARADKGARVGLVVASDVHLLPQSFASVAGLQEAMDRLRQPQPIRSCCGGAWRIHFAALLDRPAATDALDLEFLDVSSPDRSEARRRVFSSSIAVVPGQVTVFVDDFVITQDEGFASGHDYEVFVRRPAGSDRTALAKGRFTLK
jgi:hypothetical protein